MIVITCPKCKHVFEVATPPISGTIACPSCGKALRLRPKTLADALPALERQPAKSSRRALIAALGLLVLAAGIGVAYKVARMRKKPLPRGLAATRPALPTTMSGVKPTTRTATRPIRPRPSGTPMGYQIGPD